MAEHRSSDVAEHMKELKDKLSESDAQAKVEDGISTLVTKGSPELFKLIFKEAPPAGFGGCLYAHFDAPRKALMGDATGAVNSACGAMSAVMAPVVTAAALACGAAGPVGIAAGWLTKEVVGKVPGSIISWADISSIKSHIIIRNFSSHHAYIEELPRFGHGGLFGLGRELGDGKVIYSPNADHCFVDLDGNGLHKTHMIPKATIMSASEDGNAMCGNWAYVLNSKRGQYAICLHVVGRDEEQNITTTWAIGVEKPAPNIGEQMVDGFINFFQWGNGRYWHHAGIKHLSGGDNTKEHVKPLMEDMHRHAKHVTKLGVDNGDFSGKSCAYWEDWNTCIIELHDD